MTIPIQDYTINKKSGFNLKNHKTIIPNDYKEKKNIKEELIKNTDELRDIQRVLYASGSHSVLLIFQAMDAGGKDSTIKHVMSGINPQGCMVHNFKQPSHLELDHNFLWRHQIALPRRGMIGIFNRSHYENVLISKVHPELVLNERIPTITTTDDITKQFWDERYKQIRRFEKTAVESGTLVLKFFLNISKDEQKNRFLERINNPEKNWKFDKSDLTERQYWSDYQKAYENAIEQTSTKDAPWYVIPADNKWYARLCIGKIVHEKIKELNLKMPSITKDQMSLMKKAKKTLEQE
jgi:PPK2 family polyphosphate:nucleotide phosphotransferase